MKSKIIVITLAVTTSFNSFGQVRLDFPEARLPEEIIYAASSDSVINAGLLFHPEKDSTKPIAVIWVHGWGVNFYSPSYILCPKYIYILSVSSRSDFDLTNEMIVIKSFSHLGFSCAVGCRVFKRLDGTLATLTKFFGPGFTKPRS